MDITPCDPAMTKWLQNLVPRSRNRAGRARFAHELAADHCEQLFQQQKGRCAISGMRFSLAEFAGVLVKRPFAPSLDRILSQGGYTADNVRLVCTAVNFGMGQWGEELYLTLAQAAVEHSKQIGRTIKAAKAIMANAKMYSGGEVGVATRSSGQRDRIVAAEMIPLMLSGEGHSDGEVAKWFSGQRERIAAAETIASTLSGEALIQQRRRIASPKRNLTLGPAGLKAAAAKAIRARTARP